MDQVHQRAAVGGHKPLGERHVIPLVGRGRLVGDLEVALVDEVLRRELVAVLGREIRQRLLRHREVIAAPVGEEAAVALVGAPDPDKVVEQAREPDHRRVGWVSHQLRSQSVRKARASGRRGSMGIRCSLSQWLVRWLYIEISSQIR